MLAILPDLEASLDTTNGATFTVVFDQAPYIQQSIESLANEGLLGLLFAVIVILIFLLSVRATLVTAISIPTIVLITFIGMQAFGYSLNILTLGALTIAIGRVVDDSIVVIENIKRHSSATPTRRRSILRAVREVAGAITASTITTVAVFLPLAFVERRHRRAVPPVRPDRHDRDGRVAARRAHDRAGARVLVPAAREGTSTMTWARSRRRPSSTRRTPSRPSTSSSTRRACRSGYLPIIDWTLKHSW